MLRNGLLSCSLVFLFACGANVPGSNEGLDLQCALGAEDCGCTEGGGCDAGLACVAGRCGVVTNYEGTWDSVPDFDAPVSGITGSHTDDIWVASPTGLAHWDGDRFATPAVGENPDVVLGTPSGGWAYRAGSNQVARWDGQFWQTESLPPATYKAPELGVGIWQSSVADVWFAVEAEDAAPDVTAYLARYDGKEFTLLLDPLVTADWGGAVPNPISAGVSTPWGSGSNDVWAFRLRRTLPDGPDFQDLVHFDGATWESVDVDFGGVMHGGFAVSAQDQWLVGEGGRVFHYDGEAFTPVQSWTSQDLFAVWASADNDVWAVGANGTAVRFDGDRFRPVETGTSQDLTVVHGVGPFDIWAGGSEGLWRYQLVE